MGESYMDIFVQGRETIKEAKEKRKQLTGILKEGGFALGKWTTRDNKLAPSREATKRFIIFRNS